MDWDSYYATFYDWATSTQIKKMSSLTSFGASAEVSEVAQEMCIRDRIETGYLDGLKDTTLNPVFLCEELERGIEANNDYDALSAFNYFR